jgi:DNA-binding transcriptional ArsR family regulator
MSTVFKALADPTRRHILKLLRGGPQTAGALAAHFDLSKPTLSAHFAVLREANLVHSQRDGKQLIYHLHLSVLEDALLGFAQLFGIGAVATEPASTPVRHSTPTPTGDAP